MKYFIATNGRVYADKWENKKLPRLDVETNLFDSRDEAWMVARELEEYNPMKFYGKPLTKKGLLADARGDSTEAYRKRR